MRRSPFTAVYDACVLYPAPLRDLLIGLGLSRPHLSQPDSAEAKCKWANVFNGDVWLIVVSQRKLRLLAL